MYLVKLNAGHIFGLSLLPTNIFFQVSLYEKYDPLKYEIYPLLHIFDSPPPTARPLIYRGLRFSKNYRRRGVAKGFLL